MNESGLFLLLVHEISLLLHAGFLKGAPLLWAALAGAYSERSGIVNIGLEGMMLVGAFAAAAGGFWSGNPWLGLLLGALCGGLAGLLHAWICLYWRADQIVSGMGINLIALGLTGFLLFRFFNARGNSPEVPKLPALRSEAWMPSWFADLVFPLSSLHLVLMLVFCATLFVFYRTRFGLRLRACGENSKAVRSVGIRTTFYRYSAVGISGVLAGMGGAQLAIGDISQFSTNMTNGRGFVALAILTGSGWRPGRAALLCFAFGVSDALSERMQAAFPGLPARALLALPFVLALGVLSLRRQTCRPPQSLGEV